MNKPTLDFIKSIAYPCTQYFAEYLQEKIDNMSEIYNVSPEKTFELEFGSRMRHVFYCFDKGVEDQLTENSNRDNLMALDFFLNHSSEETIIALFNSLSEKF